MKREIQPVALADENTHFADTIAQAFDIAQVAVGRPIQAVGNRKRCLFILDAGRPLVKNSGGVDFVIHGPIVARKLQENKPVLTSEELAHLRMLAGIDN